jgi:DnaK suppressor protein
VDDIDRAKQLEQWQRQRALDEQLARGRAQQTPRSVDGVRVCLDCEAPIPAQRLAYLPGAVRCVQCQTLAERATGR